MSNNATLCGNCNKEMEREDGFFVMGKAIVKSETPKFKMLAICKKCCRRIPESLHIPQDLVDADTVIICKAEKVGRYSTFSMPLYGVHKSVINFCVGNLGEQFWPKPVRM